MEIVIILGILNLSLVFFQMITGYHLVKVRIRIHKICGWILAFSAVIHGLLAVFATNHH